MTRDQQRELSRQQLVNMLSVGTWFDRLVTRCPRVIKRPPVGSGVVTVLPQRR